MPGNHRPCTNLPSLLLGGDYPDPSIIREGKDFYMTNSSFNYAPGLLVWHSTDLVNWTPIARALHALDGSVYAPDLVKYKGRYYITIPLPEPTMWSMPTISAARGANR